MNFPARLKALLPPAWFPDDAPVLDALVGGLSALWVWLYGRAQYVQAQTRLATASEQWLELIAHDFLGETLPRQPASETDNHYRGRIGREILRTRATRAGLTQALTDLLGTPPLIFEPRNARDTKGYGVACGYGVAGGYGSYALPFQCFVQVALPITSPLSLGGVAGYGNPQGGYRIGAVEYISADMIDAKITSVDIDNVITATLPVGTIAWVNISN